jgi:hypothetical protein
MIKDVILVLCLIALSGLFLLFLFAAYMKAKSVLERKNHEKS